MKPANQPFQLAFTESCVSAPCHRPFTEQECMAFLPSLILPGWHSWKSPEKSQGIPYFLSLDNLVRQFADIFQLVPS